MSAATIAPEKSVFDYLRDAEQTAAEWVSGYRGVGVIADTARRTQSRQLARRLEYVELATIPAGSAIGSLHRAATTIATDALDAALAA